MAFFLLIGTVNAQSQPFYVYRAENSASPYIWHLQNANAADEAGVLAYLHSEVIPLDMGSGPPSCTRKRNIDVIVRYEVVVKNPPGYPTPPFDHYVAYDDGQCVWCQEAYDKDGYFVGQQDQKSVRHKYYGSWYSFPYGGLCTSPDGTHNCTYLARPSAVLKIDDFVNSQEAEIVPDYTTWCKAGGVEFQRQDRDKNACVVVRTIPFWDGICNVTLCSNRVTHLKTLAPDLWNTTLENGCDTAANSSNIFHLGDQCVSACPERYYPGWNYTCLPCSPNCQTCTWPKSDVSGGVCTACESGAYWENDDHTGCVLECPHVVLKDTCEDKCPTHMFPDEESLCQTCAADCSECSGGMSTECTACYTAKPFLDRGACVVECPAGRYADGASTCLACSDNCHTCQGAAATCTSCDPTSAHPYFFPPASSCVDNCPSHFFVDKVTVPAPMCTACAAECGECSGASAHECTACGTTNPQNKYLQNHTCVGTCATGFYTNETLRLCELCDPSCLACAEATSCTQCRQPELLHAGHCVAACPEGYVADGSVCKQKGKEKSSYWGLWVGLAVLLVFIVIIMIVLYQRRKRTVVSIQSDAHSSLIEGKGKGKGRK